MGGPLLLGRADARAEVGWGHAMRTLALAEAWQADGGRAAYACVDPSPALLRRIADCGATPVVLETGDPDELAAVVRRLRPAWTSFDGYCFGPADHGAGRAGGGKVLVIDDHAAAGSYDADLVLDQNLGADPTTYASRPASSRVLVGPHFALLRRQFWDVGSGGHGASVLVSLGGGPHPELTPLVQAIEERAGGRSVVVLGGDQDDVAALMTGSAAAFSAAGSTVWELCACGVPMVLVTVATNQVPVARALAELGAALDLGPLDRLDPIRAATAVCELAEDQARRDAMAAVAARVTDGAGARRVCTAMRLDDVHVRPAARADARVLWTWVNDATVRESAFEQAAIPWTAHRAWLDRQLRSESTWIYIAEIGTSPVGQLRIEADPAGTTGNIDLSVASERRGVGLAAVVLLRAVERLAAESTVRRVQGLVKEGNQLSVRALLQAGFTELARQQEHGESVLVFERHVQ